jgi:hypothetical protein
LSNDPTTIVVKVLYEAVSFFPPATPNYKLLQSLFHPQARITPPKEDTDGLISLR